MSKIITDLPFTTNVNHHISQWLQKKYGFSFKHFNNVRPIIFDTKYNEWHSANNNGWESKENFQSLQVYSKKLEDNFTYFETEAARIVTSLLERTPFFRKTPINKIVDFHNSNQVLNFSIVNLVIDPDESKYLSNFYFSLIERYITEKTIKQNYSSFIDTFRTSINKTQKQLLSEYQNENLQINEIAYDINKMLDEEKGKTTRFLNDAYHEESLLIPTSTTKLENELQNNYSLFFCDFPIYFLGDMPFYFENKKERNCITPLIMPMSCDCLFIHNSLLKESLYSLNNFSLIKEYQKRVLCNSKKLIFSCHESLNLWQKHLAI